MNNIRAYRTDFIQQLSTIYDELEAENFFYLILEHKNKLKRVDLALNPNLTFADDEIENWNFILNELKQEIPIQYILGTTSFFGLDFLVNKNVLIPRPETEELVDWILKDTPRNQNLKMLDIGTGSGCIAISLAKNLKNAQVFAIDFSEKAIRVIRAICG